jgi:hypothetical protein
VSALRTGDVVTIHASPFMGQTAVVTGFHAPTGEVEVVDANGADMGFDAVELERLPHLDAIAFWSALETIEREGFGVRFTPYVGLDVVGYVECLLFAWQTPGDPSDRSGRGTTRLEALWDAMNTMEEEQPPQPRPATTTNHQSSITGEQS